MATICQRFLLDQSKNFQPKQNLKKTYRFTTSLNPPKMQTHQP